MAHPSNEVSDEKTALAFKNTKSAELQGKTDEGKSSQRMEGESLPFIEEDVGARHEKR